SGSSSSSGGSASGSSSGSTSGSNTSGSTSGSSTSTGTSSDSDNWAALHNAKRALHQDTGNLTYDDTLAAGALDHSKKCVFEHSERYLTLRSNGDYGENLAMGSGLTNDQTVDMWYDEINDYGSYWGKDDVPMGVMHFTQVVWKGTTKVGCGVYDCGSQGNLVTCRYQAAGNYLGEFAANVGELKSS
ncbi:CAP domain-containing protein, partial [Macrophomina phaseolina]